MYKDETVCILVQRIYPNYWKMDIPISGLLLHLQKRIYSFTKTYCKRFQRSVAWVSEGYICSLGGQGIKLRASEISSCSPVYWCNWTWNWFYMVMYFRVQETNDLFALEMVGNLRQEWEGAMLIGDNDSHQVFAVHKGHQIEAKWEISVFLGYICS